MKKILALLAVVTFLYGGTAFSQDRDRYALERKLRKLERQVQDLVNRVRDVEDINVNLEDRIIDLERGGVDRGEWICKIETTFKTYSAVGRSRAVAEENVIKKCNKDTLSSNCRNATCSN